MGVGIGINVRIGIRITIRIIRIMKLRMWCDFIAVKFTFVYQFLPIHY